MDKRKLAQMALTAFVVASNVPSNVQAIDESSDKEVQGVLLAAKCGGGGGCGAASQPRGRREITFTSSNQSGSAYDTSSPYQTSGSNYNYSNDPRSMQGVHGGQYSSYQTDYETPTPGISAGYQQQRTTTRTYSSANPGTETYNVDIYPSQAQDTGEYSEYRSTVVPTTNLISEEQLVEQLSPEGRTIYYSLSVEGKRTARQIATQNTFRDKNQAVREAQRLEGTRPSSYNTARGNNGYGTSATRSTTYETSTGARGTNGSWGTSGASWNANGNNGSSTYESTTGTRGTSGSWGTGASDNSSYQYDDSTGTSGARGAKSNGSTSSSWLNR